MGKRAFALFLLLGLIAAAPASAGIEQVATFGASGEANKFVKGTKSIAVNETGIGGVPAGTLYAHGASFDAEGELLNPAWGPASESIAVDQATGNVYLRSGGHIKVFNATGTQLIAEFGEQGTLGKTTDEEPEKFHYDVWPSGIAVDDSGTVYVTDNDDTGLKTGPRVMVFKPQSPGDYEHYEYTGRANDIKGIGAHLAVDDAGNLYTVDDERLFEFAPGELETPICSYKVPGANLLAMAVNPVGGEVFYTREGAADKMVHQLSACNPQGKFEQTATFAMAPKSSEIQALAFNPSLAWSGSRPAGILYAITPESYDGAPIGTAGLGYIFAPAEIRFPQVESQSASSVTATTASLGAQINPKGSITRYAFQYETEAEYEANEAGERFAGAAESPLGGAALPAAQEGLSAAASLVGLAPDTAYRYRAVATSHCEPEQPEEPCETVGEEAAFHTFPAEAPGLPDNRAWELVSPVQKNAGEVFPLQPGIGSFESCRDDKCKRRQKPGFAGAKFPKQSAPGGDAVAYEGLPFSATEGAARFNEYISKRTASGWQTTILAPALLSGSTGKYTAFDAELNKGIIHQGKPSLTPEASGEFANLYTQPTANPASLTPLLGLEPPNGATGFQIEYAGASDDLSHRFFEANDALTAETPFAPEALDGGFSKYNLYESVGGRLRLINVAPGNTETAPGAAGFGFGSGGVGDLQHSISADGSRVYWSDEAGQLYVRVNGEATIEIPDSGKYLTASEDGSRVLLSDGHIYDLQTEETTDLTEGEGGFLGVSGHSEDLSHVYFVDTAALTGEEENEYGDKAQAGEDNLYAWSEGDLAFVATLDPGDVGTKDAGGTWLSVPQGRTAEASPDGRWLAFRSRAPLSGYDSSGPCAGNQGAGEILPGPCAEAFLYDSSSGELRCASCDPSGALPLGSTILPEFSDLGVPYLPQPRYLTDSGRLYFDSRDSLVPADTNNGAEDVYQYEPQGIGSCKREAGCTNLISAGHEAEDANFLAIDDTGRNVFFTSRDQLVLKDKDDLMDLYVAREGGGIAAETEASRGECQGEACQPAIAAPNDPTPGSSSFEGAGNVDEKKAAKKKHKHKKHAKKHKHKKAHRKKGKRRHAKRRQAPSANHNRGGQR